MMVAPSFRADIGCMNDVAEEIARIYGYNKIISGKLRGETTQGGYTPKQNFEINLENMLCGIGLESRMLLSERVPSPS